MLSDRRRRVLRALIEEYISTAAPVSSRALVGHHGLDVSSATVRNELYVLEEDGYVVSPHVSSGRIPTDTGYRTFVDELLQDGSLGTSDAQVEGGRQLSQELQDSASELDDLLRKTSRALSRFTDCLALVIAPRITSITLKQIALVKMDAHHTIVVLALKDGRVLNCVVELEGEYTSDELHAMELQLNSIYDVQNGTGTSPQPDADALAHAELLDPRSGVDLERLVAGIGRCLFEEERDRIHFNGIEDLFSQPELQKMSLALGFARLLDDDLTLFRLLGDCISNPGVTVRIGHENSDELFSDISVVSSSYGGSEGEGVVAIVGPTRMNYKRIIDAVRRTSGFLDQTIKNQDAS